LNRRLFRSIARAPPPSTLFPYTTLFRSDERASADADALGAAAGEGAHGGGAAAHVGAVPDHDALGDAALDHRGAEGAGVEVHERSEEHTSELQSRFDLVCRLLLEKKKKI